MKYFYEIQTPHAPGCGWLRSPYGRDTWEKAAEEGLAYIRNMQHSGKMKCGMRIHCEDA